MENSKKISFVLRIAAIAIMVIFFIPTFCVSCEDYINVEFSAFDAAVGIIDDKIADDLDTDDYDDTGDGIDASPILFGILICAVLILKYANTKFVLSLVCGIGCLIGMPLMSIGVKEYIKDAGYPAYMISVETTLAYKLHILLSIIIIIALLFEKYVLEDADRYEKFEEVCSKFSKTSNTDTHKAKSTVKSTSNSFYTNHKNVNNEVNTVHTPPANMFSKEQKINNSILTCKSCGKEVQATDLFCTRCGSKIVKEEVSFCAHCGAKINKETSMFCARCGTKINEEAPKDSQSWKCSCGATNHSSAKYCSVCFKNKP